MLSASSPYVLILILLHHTLDVNGGDRDYDANEKLAYFAGFRVGVLFFVTEYALRFLTSRTRASSSARAYGGMLGELWVTRHVPCRCMNPKDRSDPGWGLSRANMALQNLLARVFRGRTELGAAFRLQPNYWTCGRWRGGGKYTASPTLTPSEWDAGALYPRVR